MRAAFPYYIQGLLRWQVHLRQRFRLAACAVTSRLLWGGRRIRAPTIHRSSGRDASSRTMETSDDPGLRAPQLGGSLPVMSKCCTQIRSLRLQRPQRANLGLWVATILPSKPRLPTLGESSKAWLGLLHGPALENRSPAGSRRSNGEGAAIMALRWQRKSRCRVADGPGQHCCVGSCSWGPQDLAAPWSLGSPGLGQRRWPAWRKEATVPS